MAKRDRALPPLPPGFDAPKYPQASTVSGWLAKGLGGYCAMIAGAAENGVLFSRSHADAIVRQCRFIIETVERFRRS